MKIGIINGWWRCPHSSLFTQLVECQFKRLLSTLLYYSFSSLPRRMNVRKLFIDSYSEVENSICYEIHSTNQYGAEKYVGTRNGRTTRRGGIQSGFILSVL